MDPLDDILSESVVVPATRAGKFLPKAKAKARSKSCYSSEVVATKEAETASNDILEGAIQFEDDKSSRLSIVADTTFSNAVTGYCLRDGIETRENASILLRHHSHHDILNNEAGSDANRLTDEFNMHSPPEWYKQGVPVGGGSFDLHDIMLETEVEGAFSRLETLDILPDTTFASGHKGKYRPIRTVEEQPGGVSQLNATSLPFGTALTSEGSMPTFPSLDSLNDPCIDFGGFVSADVVNFELTANEGQNNSPMTHSDAIGLVDIHLKDAPNMADKKNSKVRKQRYSYELVDELADDHNDDGFTPETARNSATDDDDYRVDIDCDHGTDDDDDRVESASKKRKTSRKSKKAVTEKENPIPKRQREKKTQDRPIKEDRKKFSHSTRRKKRHVDKIWLETAEEELDYQRIPIKQLIMLADHNERLAGKEEKASETPLNNPSTENNVDEENDDEENNDKDKVDEQMYITVQKGNEYFNHQSYSKRTARTRWLKNDTEKFYEAVRQFGTDFSLIQQLFPERTRHQIKLKYKKEERQHPLMLSEAVTSRTKDNSCFHTVIKQLREAAAAEAEADRNGDLNLQTNDETVKSAEDEDGEYVGYEADVTQVHSPVKDYENDDDDTWS